MRKFYKVNGFDFLGFPFIAYVSTRQSVRSAKAMGALLYCEDTGHSVTSVTHTTMMCYAWYRLTKGSTTPEEWTGNSTTIKV